MGISLNVLADNQGCAAVVEEIWAYDGFLFPEKANTFRPINKIDLDTLHMDLSNSDPNYAYKWESQ